MPTRRLIGSGTTAADGFTALSDPSATVDAKGVAHQTVVFVFGGQPAGCDALQITVSGDQVDAVEPITNSLLHAPFRSNEPLVTTTGTATAAPPVVACEGVADADTAELAVSGAAIVGGGVRWRSVPAPGRRPRRVPDRSANAGPARLRGAVARRRRPSCS